MSARSPAAAEALWRVRPLQAPAIRRRCPRCDEHRLFESTGKFRVNGQGRRVDAWLIRACGGCGARWKQELYARARPEEIPIYLGLEANDPDLALAVGCDPARLAGLEATAAPFAVEGVGPAELASLPWVRVRVALEPPFPLRLDQLLCQHLGLSRSRLQRLALAGDLLAEPEGRALRRPVRPDQRLLLRGEALIASDPGQLPASRIPGA